VSVKFQQKQMDKTIVIVGRKQQKLYDFTPFVTPKPSLVPFFLIL
jgi:hypothetical protein